MSEGLSPGSYRYERKLVVEGYDCAQIVLLVRLHPALFVKTYPPRYVNNIYLDTDFLEHYAENLMGAADRVKVRVRWYGNFCGLVEQPVLEYKIKHGLVGTKARYSLTPFVMGEGYCDRHMQEVFQLTPDLSDAVRFALKPMRITLFNRYHRAYYATHDRRFRLTVDSGLTFFRTGRLGAPLMHGQTDYQHTIVELKYNPEDEPRANRIVSHFPFRLARNSKYAQGIERGT